MRELLKFKKDSEGNYLVKFQENKGELKVDTITIESTDTPRKELLDALQAMATHALSMCEFPSTWKLNVIGVTVTHTNDVQGLVITSSRDLEGSNAPLIINTPHFTREPYNETDESGMGIFTGECGMALDRLEKLALKYVDGARAQLELPLVKKELAAVGG
jgi:hypothetical protein